MKNRVQKQEGVMKKKIWGFLVFIVMASLLVPALSFACSYTFDVSLVSRTLDATRSAQDTLGFDNWYVWTYKVEVVKGEVGKALSNWVLALPNCYITSPDLFKEIEASANEKSWGESGTLRIYADEHAVDPDPNSGLSGLKWDEVKKCWRDELDRIGEFGYFSFSVPTNIDIETDWAVKAGTKEVTGKVEGPACPECTGTPEPLSMVLFGSGLAGLLFRKKKSRG